MTSAMYSSTGAAKDGSTGRIKPGCGRRQLRTLLYVKDVAYLHSVLRPCAHDPAWFSPQPLRQWRAAGQPARRELPGELRQHEPATRGVPAATSHPARHGNMLLAECGSTAG